MTGKAIPHTVVSIIHLKDQERTSRVRASVQRDSAADFFYGEDIKFGWLMISARRPEGR